MNNVVSTGSMPNIDEDMFAKVANVKSKEDLDALLGF
jgi:hypothetical protein